MQNTGSGPHSPRLCKGNESRNFEGTSQPASRSECNQNQMLLHLRCLVGLIPAGLPKTAGRSQRDPLRGVFLLPKVSCRLHHVPAAAGSMSRDL